jgi:hypothetical protein
MNQYMITVPYVCHATFCVEAEGVHEAIKQVKKRPDALGEDADGMPISGDAPFLNWSKIVVDEDTGGDFPPVGEDGTR